MIIPIHAEFNPFIQKQIELIHQRNDSNATKEIIKQIAQEEIELYRLALENLLRNKDRVLKKDQEYTSKIFILEKHIKYNKKRNNTCI